MKNFFRNIRGNVAINFAIISLVVMASAGAAIDYSKLSSAQSDFQNAADSAALAAAMKYKRTNWTQASKVGHDFIKSHAVEADDLTILSKSVELIDGAVVVTINSKVKTALLSVIGRDEFDFETKAVVKIPDYPVEVALVLDTTFSMSVGGKIQALKRTAKEFVDTLLIDAEENVKISVVPFAQYVNVGVGYYGSSWLNAKHKKVVIPRSCTSSRPIVSQTGCTTTTHNHPKKWIPESCSPAQYNDGVLVSPASCTPGYWKPAYTTTSKSCEHTEYGDPVTTCTPERTYWIYWNGCVASRTSPLNIEDRSFSNRVPGPLQKTCPSPITPLTDRKSTLKAAINGLNPVGNTYIQPGLAWGLRTLSRQAPFSEAMVDTEFAAKKGRRYVVLMTDGVNINSVDYRRDSHLNTTVGFHDGSSVGASNAATSATCEHIKSKNIELFTVSFGSGVDSATEALLKQCATDEEYYFDANTNKQLELTFRSIADKIRTVYLSE